MKLLNFINDIFDYIYYRLFKAYRNSEGDFGITAILGISLFQMLLLFAPTIKILKNLYGRDLMLIHKVPITTPFIVLQVLLIIKAYLRYKKLRVSLEKRWENEKEPNKSIHGILVVLALLLPFILAFII